MKKISGIVSVVVLVSLLAINFMSFDKEEEAIKKVIETGYVHGAFNELNPEAMAVTFHKDFAIFSPGKDGEIRRYPIADWIENTKKTKADPNFDASKNVWVHKFANVEVLGTTAAVKLELYQDGKLVYTDYLSLLKFDDEWKIVAKVYHRHSIP